MTFNPSLKNALLFFAIGLLLGLFLSFLWGQLLIPEYKLNTQIKSPKELVKEVTASETIHVRKADTLNRRSQKLQEELSITKAALKKANEKADGLRSQVFKLLDARFAVVRSDTSNRACDSLALTVPILIAATEEKDSLYQSAIINLESQVQTKDSTLALQTNQYADLKSAFTKSIEAQAVLRADNKTLTQTLKRQRTKSKIVSVALAILSGAAATYLLHR